MECCMRTGRDEDCMPGQPILGMMEMMAYEADSDWEVHGDQQPRTAELACTCSSRPSSWQQGLQQLQTLAAEASHFRPC